MACHIDGFLADILAASNTATQVAERLVRPGKKVRHVRHVKIITVVSDWLPFHKLSCFCY